MAIQPIDLQTLYSQMDKVSKNVVQQQQQVQLHGAMELDGLARKDIEKKESIEKTQEEEGMTGVKDGESSKKQNQQSSQRKKEQEELTIQVLEVIKDPSLGKNFDISG